MPKNLCHGCGRDKDAHMFSVQEITDAIRNITAAMKDRPSDRVAIDICGEYIADYIDRKFGKHES